MHWKSHRREYGGVTETYLHPRYVVDSLDFEALPGDNSSDRACGSLSNWPVDEKALSVARYRVLIHPDPIVR